MNIHRLKISTRIEGGPGGMSHASVGAPPSVAVSQDPRWLRLEFTFDRVPPLMVNVDGGHRAIRVDSRSSTARPERAAWLARVDDRIDSEFNVKWIEPSGRAQLVAAELRFAPPSKDDPSRPTDETEYSCVADYERTVRSLDTDTRRDIREARLFFLRLDLATSLGDASEAPLIASAFDIDEKLIPSDPVQREQLAVFLEQRWRCRATIAAFGASQALLPQPSDEQRSLATRVTKLFIQLIHDAFGSVAEGRDALLMFANGSLRLDIADDQLNCEPNSLAIASFAEVVDIAVDRYTGLEGKLLEHARCLRRMFVSMIEPYCEIYRASRSFPRRAAYYARQGSFVDARAWSRERLREHARTLQELDSGGFAVNWGRTLEQALSDEWTVIRAQAERGSRRRSAPSA